MEIKHKKNHKGFSLVELIIVIGLTAILAITITTISMSSLLSSSRVRNLVKVRQTGDYALSQIQQLVRNAKSISGCDSSNDEITITGQDGAVTIISKSQIGATGTYQIASSSATTTRYLNSEEIPADSFDLSCEPSDSNPNLINVSFTLSNNTQSTRVYDKSSVDFETAIQIRN